MYFKYLTYVEKAEELARMGTLDYKKRLNRVTTTSKATCKRLLLVNVINLE